MKKAARPRVPRSSPHKQIRKEESRSAGMHRPAPCDRMGVAFALEPEDERQPDRFCRSKKCRKKLPAGARRDAMFCSSNCRVAYFRERQITPMRIPVKRIPKQATISQRPKRKIPSGR